MFSISQDCVAKSGDTMSGNLKIVKSSPAFYLDSEDMNIAGTPSASTSNVIYLRDKNLRNAAAFTVSQSSVGNMSLHTRVRRYNNSTNIDNDLELRVNADGTKSVTVSDPGAWQQGIDMYPSIINGITYYVTVASYYTFFYRVGKLVVFQIEFTQDIASGTKIATLPSDIVPNKQWWFLSASNVESDKTARVEIRPDRDIFADAPIYSYYFMSGSFIIN